MKEFHALTDDELEETKRAGVELLLVHYRALREHHIKETAHLAAKEHEIRPARPSWRSPTTSTRLV
jgi:hypothetical protein